MEARRAGCAVQEGRGLGQAWLIAYELGVRLPRRVDSEAQEEGPVRAR